MKAFSEYKGCTLATLAERLERLQARSYLWDDAPGRIAFIKFEMLRLLASV